ncbi:MAG TPA: hypothetical protein VK974_10435 [Methylophilaceae bacterium]|nr:hypothetical protein [Methylophilaceae bacterium]
MKSNLDKYKEEIQKLINDGDTLLLSMQRECHPVDFEKIYKKALKPAEYKKFIDLLPKFSKSYQTWYSEAHAVIRQLIPDRLMDFVRLYEKPKTRKEIAYGNYVIEDYLQGLRVTLGSQLKVGPSAAISQFEQQLAILKSAQKRFDSSLFDMVQLVQADLLDSELEAARLLLKNKFYRAAGAIAGVVIEKHLGQVCTNHNISINKKNPTINDFIEILKDGSIIEIPQWRFIQHLADLRNLCDHNKNKEPTNVEIEDLITGTEKITKTIF